MVSISLCMIVKNEEDVLARCLDSAAGLVDEIVIVDTGSTDRTREIAARYTDKIFDFPWRDDFAAARNESFSHAAMDYCLWLDADEVVPSVGTVLYGDFAVTHKKTRPSDPDRNLRIYEAQLAAGQELEPRQQFYYGRELYYHKRWEEALAVFETFLEEGRGWVENNIDACCHCAYCHRELGDEQAALAALLRTFTYDWPRAEVCCEIGRWFFQKEQHRQAAYWYTLALTCIQLCVCYSRLGDAKRAETFNELAALYKPDSPAVHHNRAIFRALPAQTA